MLRYKSENFLSLFCFQSNAGTYMFASKHLLWRFYQINDFKHAQIKIKRHHRQVLLEFSPATSSTTKNMRALIWILITAAQCLCLSHSFSALKLKIGCYFSNHTVMAREFDSICVQVCLCARETERERQSDSSLGPGLIGSNGFLCWGRGMVWGSMGLVFGSFSKYHST